MRDDTAKKTQRRLYHTDRDWGRLTALVLEEHGKERDELSRNEAIQRYIKVGCSNAVFLLDWMERHPNAECVCTSDHNGTLSIGLPDHGISPVLWLLYLAARVDELSAAERLIFDESCSYIALAREMGDSAQREPTSLH